MTQKVFGISGWKNSGKTGLAVRIVTELTARGYRVSTIKHAHHDFDIDKVGADSWRHRNAGAHEVTIVSGTRFAIMHELRGAPEPSFEDILARIAPCDLVLIEGYKYEPGEAIGIIAAQSISEPATQMTMRSYTMASQSDRLSKVTHGLPRLI